MYIAYHFIVSPQNPGIDILLAELEDTAFESFEETEQGLSAYVQASLHTKDILNEVSLLTNPEFSVTYTIEEIETVNWNEEWEKNFQPITVGNDCYIRAPFHESKNLKHEIVIEPKMSFGTGHHQTTFMMLQHLLDTELSDKRVLDMGCGTAVLAILAAQKGARSVDAIDIDNWCYLNSIENAERNHCPNINIYEGDASLLKGKEYDIIIANINRNILLNDIPIYASCMPSGGLLFLSGFYKEDILAIDQCCQSFGLNLDKQSLRDNWAALKYVKL